MISLKINKTKTRSRIKKKKKLNISIGFAHLHNIEISNGFIINSIIFQYFKLHNMLIYSPPQMGYAR